MNNYRIGELRTQICHLIRFDLEIIISLWSFTRPECQNRPSIRGGGKRHSCILRTCKYAIVLVIVPLKWQLAISQDVDLRLGLGVRKIGLSETSLSLTVFDGAQACKLCLNVWGVANLALG